MYPVATIEKCAEVIVVALRPTRPDAIIGHWQGIDRLMRRRELSIEAARDLYFSELHRRGGDRNHAPHYEPPVNLPLRDPEGWPQRIVLIAPSKPLGNFLTGTLNFRPGYTRRLIVQGYQDAMNAIRENGLGV
jgi:hypothetical protein